MKRLLLPAVFLLAACESGTPPATVTVYVPADYEARAKAWLPESGLAVTVVAGDSTANTNLVIAKQDAPRADILIAAGVADLWKAAESGALRPITSEALERVPEALRDPDRFWAATDTRHMTIVTAPGLEIMSVIDLKKLAAPEFNAQVCLSSSKRADNRALIAMLIAEMGNRPAERLVRGWVRNLATAPFASEEELVEAVRSAECVYGIVSSDADTSGAWRIEVPARYYNIRGVGVARHAQHPEAAQQLVDWMLRHHSVEVPQASGSNVGQAGWFDEDARLLAERAGYR